MAGDDVTIHVRADNQTGPAFAGVRASLASLTRVSAGAVAGFGALAPQIAGVASALAQLAPAAGVAATGALAAASAGAALKVGMVGVQDALQTVFDPKKADKYNEALKRLSPNARSFVQEIKNASPALDKIRRSVQDKLFADLDKTLAHTAKATAPALKRSLLDSAGALNLMAKGVGESAAQLGTSGTLGKALGSANRGLKNLTGVPSVLVKGFGQVAAAAGPSFERLTKAGGGALDRLGRAMDRGFKSGGMQRAIETAVHLAGQLGQGLGNVGKVLVNIGKAADQSGAGLIGNFKALTGELAKVTATKGVQDGLRTLFQTMGTVGRTGAGLLGEALKAIAPAVTKLGPPVQTLVKDLGAGLTSVMRSLSPVLTSAADSFGRIVTAVSPLATVLGGLVSGALDALAPVLAAVGDQAALLVESLAAGLGPTLSHLPGLLGPLMGMFGDLAALWVRVQNDVLKALLPSFKRLGEAFGRVAGSLAPLLPLVTDFVEFGLRGVGKVAEVGARALGRLADAVSGRVAPALESMAKWAGGHKLEIMEVFNAGKLAAVNFAIAVGEALPTVFGLFKALGTIVLESLGAIVNGAADAFGWIPGIGPKIKDAAKGFNLFADVAKKGMDQAGKDIKAFAADALPKLKRHKLEMQINNWRSQIGEAKRLLSDKNLPPSKRAKLLADIKQWQDNIARAKAQIGGVKGAARKLTVTSNANAVAGSARRAIASVQGKTVHINTILTKTFRTIGDFQAAHGRASGGPIVGGSGTRDDVPIMAMGGEYVVNKGAYAKHRALVEAINEDRLPRFARGGRVSKAEREARSQARGALTISHFGRMAGYSNDEFRSALGKPGDIGPLVDALNQWRSTILKATHGGVERGLLRSLDHAGRSLLKYSRQHDKLSDQLDKAKSKLSDLRSSFSQMRDSVASGIKGSANITQLAGGDDGRGLAVADIMGGLVASRDKASSFAGALKDLRRRGLSKEMIAQIAEAGIEGGGLKTAEALMGASGSELKSMNALQAQIAKAAKSAGTTAADSMYGAGIKAAEGLVKGLQKKEAAIEKQMMRIAKSMEKAIKRALGIHSPSKVMQEIGHFTAEGFAVGMQRNRSADRAWASMLAVPPSPRPARGTALGPAGGGGRPIELVVNLDSRVIARQLVDPLRSEIWDRAGGNVQKALGR